MEILAGGKLNTKAKYTDLGKSLEEAGIYHICIHVKNLDKTLAALKKSGVSSGRTILTGSHYPEI